MSVVARTLDRFIGWYQVLTEGRVSPCRYVPTCSTYAREALAEHGGVRGTFYATRRLCRCHPWGGHGYDPVPGTDEPASPPIDVPTHVPVDHHHPSPVRRTS